MRVKATVQSLLHIYVKRSYAFWKSLYRSRIHLHIPLAVNNQSKIDIDIHRIAAGSISHPAQLNRDSGCVSDSTIVGAHIDVCYVVDTVSDFYHVSIPYRIIAVANIKVITCKYTSALFGTLHWTTIQGRLCGVDEWSNNEHIPVSISLPVPANPTPLPSPGPPEFVIDPELSV